MVFFLEFFVAAGAGAVAAAPAGAAVSPAGVLITTDSLRFFLRGPGPMASPESDECSAVPSTSGAARSSQPLPPRTLLRCAAGPDAAEASRDISGTTCMLFGKTL